MTGSLSCNCIRLLIALGAALCCAALDARAVQAQTAETLIVTLHDAAGAPIAGAQVVVRAPDLRELARGQTDAAGGVTLEGITADEVLVAVQGSLASGTQLTQPGQDADGIRLWLRGGITLALRAETDGTVLPDPLMISADDSGVPAALDAADVALLPTAPPATLPTPTTLAAVGTPAGSTATNNATPWWAWLLLAGLVAACGIVVALMRRWR